jgi:hypothetical protein
MPQAPATHVAEPLVGAGHVVPQLPQLLGSLLSSTQIPPQFV